MADIRINALATTATTPASDDYLALDGTAQGTRKILATNIANNVTDVILGTSGPSVKSSLSARAPRQGLVFDGTAGATVSVPAFGTSDFSVVAVIAPNQLATSTILTGSSNAFDLGYNSAGRLDINLANVSAVLQVAGAVVAGKYQVFTYTRTGGVGTLYRNGISIASGTDNSNYSAAITSVGGSVAFSTGYVFPLIYNRALSASEVVALYEAGAPAGADYNSASNTAINTSAFTNDGTFGLTYGTFSGASATGFTAAQATATAGMAEMKPNLSAKVGKRYRVSFTATLTSGQAPTFQTQDGSGNQCFPQVTVTNGANSFEVTLNSFASGTLVTSFYTSNVTSYAISSFSMVPLGLLLAPDAAQAGGGLVWYDTSGNAANITLPASGVSWNVPSSQVLGGNWSATGTFGIGSTSSVAGFSSTEAAFIVGATRTDGSGVYPVTQTISDSRAFNSSNPPAGGGIGFGYKFNSGGSTAIGPSIQGFKENTTDGNYAGGLRFLARANGASPAEAARITSSGNYLIGTTTDVGPRLLSKAKDNTYAGAGIGIVDQSAGTSYITRSNGTFYISNNGSTDHFALDASGNATFAGKITANGAGSTFKGTATNDSAAAGYMGEYAETYTVYASRITLTTDTVANVASVSLTAGDWDVSGNVELEMSGVTSTDKRSGVSTTSASLTNNPDTCGVIDLPTTTLTGYLTIPTPTVRISIASTTTVYLPTKVTFSAGTTKAWGIIRARRVR